MYYLCIVSAETQKPKTSRIAAVYAQISEKAREYIFRDNYKKRVILSRDISKQSG